MLPARSNVISSTLLRAFKDICCRNGIILSDFVPSIIATKDPRLPLASLLVTTVYSSPCDKDVSSIDNRGPKLYSNKSPFLALY